MAKTTSEKKTNRSRRRVRVRYPVYLSPTEQGVKEGDKDKKEKGEEEIKER
jgi:hypothetical protein